MTYPVLGKGYCY